LPGPTQDIHIPTMTIVSYGQHPKHAKPAQEIKVLRMQTAPRGRAWKLPDPVSEAEARVTAFLARMIRPRS
jgi:hypothetical protein